ncbi:C6 transcription factor [Diplocarpon mali]|nr:C6 transcription factor [Diplocarpon mali]
MMRRTRSTFFCPEPLEQEPLRGSSMAMPSGWWSAHLPLPRNARKRISRPCLRCRRRRAKCCLLAGLTVQQMEERGSHIPSQDRRPAALAKHVYGMRPSVSWQHPGGGGKRVRRSYPAPSFLDSRPLPVIEEEPTSSPYAGVKSQHHHADTSRRQKVFAEPRAQSPISSVTLQALQLPGFPGQLPSGRETFSAQDAPITPVDVDETSASTDLHAISEALDILSHAAQLDACAKSGHGSHTSDNPTSVIPPVSLASDAARLSRTDTLSPGPLQYPLGAQGLLTAAQISHPITRTGPHILTAIIAVAARDLPRPLPDNVLQICFSYMHQLASEIIAGKRCDVEAVEALLLLAEWEPQDSLSEAREVGCREEDRAARMHVSLALRIGYFLGHDRTAIKNENEDKAAHLNRRRIAWAGELSALFAADGVDIVLACYISDRQLSARVGRAFWSRRPVALSGIGRRGIKHLMNFVPCSRRHQTKQTTQCFAGPSRSHPVVQQRARCPLFIMGSSMKLIQSRMGFLIAAGLPNVNATLHMFYEYLRLYSNAYAFQATVTRAAGAKSQGMVAANEPSDVGIPSPPDARFIHKSVDAAKSPLSITNNCIDAEDCVRYLPLRLSLYCVKSAVFLYKAWSFEVLSPQEKLGIRRQRKDPETRYRMSRTPKPAPPPPRNPEMHVCAQQDGFSWLDLQAVSELVTAEQGSGAADAGEYTQFGGSGDWNLAMMDGDDINRFFCGEHTQNGGVKDLDGVPTPC